MFNRNSTSRQVFALWNWRILKWTKSIKKCSLFHNCVFKFGTHCHRGLLITFWLSSRDDWTNHARKIHWEQWSAEVILFFQHLLKEHAVDMFAYFISMEKWHGLSTDPNSCWICWCKHLFFSITKLELVLQAIWKDTWGFMHWHFKTIFKCYTVNISRFPGLTEKLSGLLKILWVLCWNLHLVFH